MHMVSSLNYMVSWKGVIADKVWHMSIPTHCPVRWVSWRPVVFVLASVISSTFCTTVISSVYTYFVVKVTYGYILQQIAFTCQDFPKYQFNGICAISYHTLNFVVGFLVLENCLFVWLFCNDFNFEVNSQINRCLQGFSTGVKPVVKFVILRKCKTCGAEFGTFFERVYMYSSLSENSLLVFFLVPLILMEVVLFKSLL